MNVLAITTQLAAVADHALSGGDYSLGELREISSALCLASARIEAKIAQRVGPPRSLLDGLSTSQPTYWEDMR